MDISKAIKETRKECILSQTAFAKELGVTQLTITRWETGKTVPNYAAMKRMLAYCEKCGIDTTKLSEAWKELDK